MNTIVRSILVLITLFTAVASAQEEKVDYRKWGARAWLMVAPQDKIYYVEPRLEFDGNTREYSLAARTGVGEGITEHFRGYLSYGLIMGTADNFHFGVGLRGLGEHLLGLPMAFNVLGEIQCAIDGDEGYVRLFLEAELFYTGEIWHTGVRFETLNDYVDGHHEFSAGALAQVFFIGFFVGWKRMEGENFLFLQTQIGYDIFD